jgi:hypothetical protein
MKNIIFAFAIFFNVALMSQGNNTPSSIEMKKGLHLVYDVTQGEKVYQYIVDFTAVSDKGVSFDWKMTDPVNKSGKITITANALKVATDLDFYPSTKTFDGSEISMIISSNIYKKLSSFKTGDTIDMGCNACFRGVTTTEVTPNNYEVTDNSKALTSLNTMRFSSIYSNGNFEVLNDSKFPLIVYFKWRLTLELKSFSYN